ncbi:MAG: CvpA family protein [Oscillospiraceae bacterium]
MRNNKTVLTAVKLLITAIVGFIYFYIKLPAINLQDNAFYTFIFILSAVYCLISIISVGIYHVESVGELIGILKKNAFIPAVICVALLALMIFGSLISAPIFRAGAYNRLLTVESGDFSSEVKEISFDQIPMLDAASAEKLGDRKLGELSDMVSQFEVANNYTQINYKGRPVRVTPLMYGDVIKWFNNRAEGTPAYLVLDMVTQNVEVVRLDDGIKYSTYEHFGRNLYRHLRFNYPTFMFYGTSFEIDDDGTPYWVCPRMVKTIGLFGGRDINGAVLVNAITGESQYYEDVPNWVDRVYFADLIMQQYDYHGMYQNGFINSILGQKGVTVTTDGYNYLAMDDDVYMYTGVTSVGGDQSNVGFILTNQRTKETRYYPSAGATEYSAMGSAEGEVQHLKYDATFPLLLNISDQPTYFMAMKDAAGLVKMYAMVNVRQYQIVAVGSTVAECESNYIQMLKQGNIVSGEAVNSSEVTGAIADIRSAVIDGNTQYFIRLQDEDWYYVISAADNELAVILSPGDGIKLSIGTDDGELRSAYSIARAD